VFLVLFNSSLFVFRFLPLFLASFVVVGRWFGGRAALCVVLVASLIFYGWWRPVFVPLLVGSIIGNYGLARCMHGSRHRRRWLVTGLVANLGLLGWFKYAGLFATTGAGLLGVRPPDLGIVLPLGISFFTFQQVMYLVDSERGAVRIGSFLDYACFVGFFAHLLAGPIVRPGEIMPQFAAHRGRVRHDDLVAGIEMFLLGLGKKLVLAEGLARFADPGFRAVAAGHQVSLIEAWVALLAYGAQIYFDFSG
jgi:alginate O-acetyltransferase complex protein AlgI